MSSPRSQFTSRFPQTVSPAELAKINRELKFFPCQNKNPEMLTIAQIEGFNRDGFIRRIKIFDKSEIAEQRASFDELLAKVEAAGGNSYSISTAHLSCGKVYDLLGHLRIATCVSDLLGENMIGWGSHYFCKMPHDGKTVTWHQDAAYWPLTPSKTVTVWLAIDDADTENACMRFIPGSHLNGCLPHQSAESLDIEVLDRLIRGMEQFGEPADVILKAGEASIHSDLLIHGSGANNSNRRRCGLTLRYCTPDVRAYFGWHEKGVVVSGYDPTSHWANLSRPELD